MNLVRQKFITDQGMIGLREIGNLQVLRIDYLTEKRKKPNWVGGTYMLNNFRTASAYASARRQQKTAYRRSFWDAISLIELTPSEWASEKLLGEDSLLDLRVSNDTIKGREKLCRLEHKLGWLPNGHRYRLGAKKKTVSKIMPFQPRKDVDDLLSAEEFERLLSTL